MKNFDAYLKECGKEIIIFGTGAMSHYLYQTCINHQIAIGCFCDNDTEKVGTKNHGIVIDSLSNIQAQNRDAIFLISVLHEEYKEAIANQLEIAGYQEYYFLTHCILHMDFVEVADPAHAEGIRLALDRSHYRVDSPFLYIEKLSFSVTQKCNLRCKDCTAFIPFIEKQEHRKTEEIFAEMDQLDALCETIEHIEISGGEALLHPDIYEIIAYALSKKSFRHVRLATNGRIVPKKEELQKYDANRFYMTTSNYGDLSTKRTELFALLLELGIDCNSLDTLDWSDCAKFQFGNKTEEEMIAAYNTCWNTCNISFDGRFFRCGFLKSAHLLHGIPSGEIESVNYMDKEKSKEEIQQELREYLYGKRYYKGCNWCIGRCETEHVSVPLAAQTTALLQYKKYSN